MQLPVQQVAQPGAPCVVIHHTFPWPPLPAGAAGCDGTQHLGCCGCSGGRADQRRCRAGAGHAARAAPDGPARWLRTPGRPAARWVLGWAAVQLVQLRLVGAAQLRLRNFNPCSRLVLGALDYSSSCQPMQTHTQMHQRWAAQASQLTLSAMHRPARQSARPWGTLCAGRQAPARQ